PHYHEVEVRIGSVISAAKMRSVSENAEGMGAYRKLADYMRTAVVAMGTKKAPLPPTVKAPGGQGPGPELAAVPSHRRATGPRGRARRGGCLKPVLPPSHYCAWL